MIACGALFIAFLLRGNFSLADTALQPLLESLLLAGLAAVLAFKLTGTNVALWRYVTVHDLSTLLAGATAAVLAFLALMFLWNRLETIPRAVPVIQWLVLVIGLCSARLLYATLVAAPTCATAVERRAAGQPVLLVGESEGTAAVARLLRVVPEIGWTPVGVLDERLTVGRMLDNLSILGRAGDLRRILAGLAIRGMRPCQIVLTVPQEDLGADLVRRLEEEATEEGIGVVNVPEMLRVQARPSPVASRGKQRLHAVAQLEHGLYLAGKRMFDIVVSAAVLGLTIPLMAVIALALWPSIGTPVLFRQARGGRGGQPFVIVKFRTMTEDYGADGRLLPDSDRIPWVGRVLRRTRLDELPQFWNVLVGSMSIVGPRPLVAAELAELPDGGAERSSIRPGITGWAQVNGGQLLDLRAKVVLDVWYAQHASPALDLKILLLTVRMVVMGERVDDEILGRVEAAYAEGKEAAWASAR